MCRHMFAIFKLNGVKSLPDRYILDQWRKDIKIIYTLIQSSYDSSDQGEDGNRYSCLLNACYKMITNAVEKKEYTEDALAKLRVMTDLYSANQEPPSSVIQVDTNVGNSATATTTMDIV